MAVAALALPVWMLPVPVTEGSERVAVRPVDAALFGDGPVAADAARQVDRRVVAALRRSGLI